MLINMNDMLMIAKENKFAVGAFNVADSCFFRTVVEEAEENNAPAIIAIHPNEFNFLTTDFFEYVKPRLMNSKVPFVLHLDHGGSVEDVLKAINAGFTSVMIDGSSLPFEENVKLTKCVVEICAPLNISVEGELGTIGSMGNSAEGGVSNITYTKPGDVRKFITETNATTLAIAIGTAHGIYPKDFKPNLKIDILDEIVKVTNVPLVLHGGSANPDDEIKEAVKHGVQKVNISSDYKYAYFKRCREILSASAVWDPDAIYADCIVEGKKVVKQKMELFNSINKAGLYR